METWQTIGTALGLGLLSGIRLYLTVFVVGLGARMGWFDFSGALASLNVLADTRVLIVAGAACMVEFLADKIPWVDSAWDSIHTFIRPVGAALLGSTVAAGMDPAYRFIIAVLVGGIALTGHSAKASTRLAANHSPEPFTNIGLSLLGDAMVPAGVWFVTAYPLAALGLVLLFLVVFAWLAPKVFRVVKLQVRCLTEFFGNLMGSDPLTVNAVPADVRDVVYEKTGLPAMDGLSCAALSAASGLKNSIGYLCPLDSALIFVGKRNFGWRVLVMERSDIRVMGFDRGWFLHRLTIETSQGEFVFGCFAGTPKEILDQLDLPTRPVKARAQTVA